MTLFQLTDAVLILRLHAITLHLERMCCIDVTAIAKYNLVVVKAKIPCSFWCLSQRTLAALLKCVWASAAVTEE